MPEIPGNNNIPGGNLQGRGAIPPRQIDVGGAGGSAPVRNDGTLTSDKTPATLPRYFGFHNEASIMARLASMGISPTLGNLRIAQQMLRYGMGLDAEAIAQLGQLWSHYGANDVVKLEALVLLLSQHLPINGPNLEAMMQLLGGGPLSHLLARLTMALKNENNPKLLGLGKKMNAFWQLGHLDKNLLAQLGEFQKQLTGIQEELLRLNDQLSDATLLEAGRLNNLLDAHKLLANQSNNAQYLPFFVWRDQQPLPAEVVVQEDGGGAPGASQFMRVTLAVETQRLGRVTVELIYMRDHLSVRFEVEDEKIKKQFDPRLVLLRQRLTAAPYLVDLLACQATGQTRAVSALLPKRRDLKKLSRAHGIL
ncbi:MAG TPA: hypothetical protein V6D47_02085 [Oscillatoriaceae cyanobacterium]